MNSSTSSTASSSDRRRKKQGIFGATTIRPRSTSGLTQGTLSSWRATPATASNSSAEEQPTFKSPFPPKNNQRTTNVSGSDGAPNVKRHRINAGGLCFSSQTVNSPSAVKTIDITNSQPYKFENGFERLTSSGGRKSAVRLGGLSERMDHQLPQQNSQKTQNSSRKDDSNGAQRRGNGGSVIGLVRHFLMDTNDNEPSSDYVNRTQLDRLKKADQILHTNLFRKDRPTQRAGAENNYNNFKKAKQGRFYHRADDDSKINDGGISVGQTPKRSHQWTASIILSCSTPYTTSSSQRREVEMTN